MSEWLPIAFQGLTALAAVGTFVRSWLNSRHLKAMPAAVESIVKTAVANGNGHPF